MDKARAAAQKIRARVVFGQNPVEDRKALRQVPTLAEYAQDVYLDHLKATRRNYASSLSFINHHLLPRFGSQHMDQISTKAISDAHKELRANGYAASTCNKLPVILRIIFNIAKKRQVSGVDINPAVDVKVFPTQSRERYLSTDEIQRLRDALEHS